MLNGTLLKNYSLKSITMTHTQKTLTTLAVLLTLTAVPAFQMASEKSRLKAELLSLQSEPAAASIRPSRTPSINAANKRTLGDIFSSQNNRLSAEELLSQLAQAIATMNGIDHITPFLMVPDLSDEELLQLIKDIQQAD